MCVDALVYRKPDPVRVAFIASRYGADAAFERWHWIPPATLLKLATEGKVSPGKRPEQRHLSPDREQHIVDDAVYFDSVSIAARMHRCSPSFVRRLFAERGLQHPVMPYSARVNHTRRSHAFRELARLARLHVLS